MTCFKIRKLKILGGGPSFLLALFLALAWLEPASADWFRPARRSVQKSVQFRSSDPKSFTRAISFILEKQPEDHIATIDAKSTMADLLFETGNYREAAQIFLQLTEAPLGSCPHSA